ncbi:fimbrial biogenesis outer membrane usher protein [Sulfitobacter porphyrae]|nr:fimbrial biogenesis outer membrane usher protein [Sulfitobacter porphyrae]
MDAAWSEEYYFEVFLNGAATELIGRFVTDEAGRIWANPQELENLGISSAGLRPNEIGDVSVAEIPNLSYEVNQADQTISFSVDDSSRATRIIDAQGPENPFLPETEEDEDQLRPTSGTGVVLNYYLGAEYLNAGSGGGSTLTAAGTFDMRAFVPFGVLSHNFSMSSSDGYASGYRRRESYWRTSFAGAAVQLQLGDMITHGPNWANPVRLGGVQIGRNFALRPDLVTMPLPSYRGTAAVPSTVEIFENNINRLTSDVPQGPFEFQNLPFSAGVNTASVVIRDAAGVETTQNVTFLASPRLLRPGLADYSLSIGYPRIGIGTDSDRYDEQLYGALYFRRGITDRLTFGLYGEAGQDLRMWGLNATAKFGELAIADFALAQSDSDLGVGQMVDLNATVEFPRLKFGARVMRADDTFTDIARMTTDTTADLFGGYAAITDLNQLSASFDLGWRSSTMQILYADTTRLDGTRDKNLGVSGIMQFGNKSTLSLSGFRRHGDNDDVYVGMSVHVPLGNRMSSGADVQIRNGRAEYGASLAKVSDSKGKDWSWQLKAAKQSRAFVSAYASRQFARGRIETALQGSGEHAQVGLRAEGALALAGGGLFLTRRVDDAFAVVDVGAPDVAVTVENRPAGVTNRAGKLLVTGLISNTSNQIAIDVEDLPIEASVGDSRQAVIPASQSGQTVRFDVNTASQSAIIYLALPSGTAPEVGARATLESTGEAFVVGYDGMVFLEGLEPANTILLEQSDGFQCQATFDYAPQAGTVTDLGQIPCS